MGITFKKQKTPILLTGVGLLLASPQLMTERVVDRHVIGILCESAMPSSEVAESLSDAERLIPEVYHSVANLVSDYRSGKIHGIVFGIKDFQEIHMQLVHRIEESCGAIPVVALYESIDKAVFKQMDQSKNAIVIAYPSELPSLEGVLTKMIDNRRVVARRHIRFPTKVHAEVHSDAGWKKLAVMQNLSKGGAQIRLKDESAYVGEYIYTYVSLQKSTTNYWVRARVAWVQEVTPDEPGARRIYEMGLEFGKAVEVIPRHRFVLTA